MSNLSRTVGASNPGLSRLAQALAGGDRTEQMAFDQAGAAQSKLAQALSVIGKNNADAAFDQARAAHEAAKTGVIAARPGQYEEIGALDAGVTLPMFRAIRQSNLTGLAPQVELAGPTEDGTTPLTGELAVTGDQRSRVSQALARLLPLVSSSGDIKFDDYAKARQVYGNEDLRQRVIAGTVPAATVGRAQAAVEAKPLYHADSSGGVLDLFGGGLDTSNPLAGATIGLRTQQAAQAKAGAAENYAQAEAARARAAESGTSMTKPFEVTGSDGKPLLVQQNKRGEISPVQGYSPKSGSAKPLTDAQAKALLFGSRMQEANKALESLKYSPAMINAKQLTDGKFILGDVANAALPDAEQMAEQAQRDFINAVLRRESGAVIADSEFANAKRQYFPQPNDKPGVLAQKARNRKLAIDGLLAEVPEGQRNSITPAAEPAAGAFSDAEKERRYQEWLKKQK